MMQEPFFSSQPMAAVSSELAFREDFGLERVISCKDKIGKNNLVYLKLIQG
jgi:hypothetical protein